MTFSRLAAWGLGPIPTVENLGHEETTRRSKCRPLPLLFFFFFFKSNFVFIAIGIATMKENKEKAVTSGDEDVQVQDDTTPVIQKPASQTGKRKTISSSVNLGDLPSRRGSKKPKPSKNPPPKVPKFTSQTVDLDEPVINVVPVQTILLVQTDPPLPTKTSRRTHP